MEVQYSNIGSRITARLKELGKTQVMLCQETGLSTTAMSSYCTGKRVPETTALYRLSKALKTSMEWLLIGEDATSEDITSEDVRASLPSCDGSKLDDSEADLVAMFRLLPSHEREDLFDLTYFKYKKYVERKKESIYWTYFDESGDEKSGPPQDLDTRDGTA